MLKQRERDPSVIGFLIDKRFTNKQEIMLSQQCNRDNIEDVINSSFSLGNYDELIDLQKGSELLKRHIQQNNKIAFIVDYDTDKHILN